ncbi:ribonucleotide reductase inhibiting protein SML1 NDAI_0D04750 [Naumovozyma dairenensis CBS 421]|uniref:Damage-regulated import facilitator 1 n=1 Tax=Naumovozyma dairenensis (strain ATCC 10597 / BCRC 20456 / CBS 421 / NBRC 0211 / NRRL Y-12639) TaxID=1071378 RepID=G0WAH7_NAUDC|nr:hypothetical protein NDAI_0D04750 [Naumovozyma dairenensis CBS 421]CCD24788.1 hypothetical protein NDAI_0D04750 [Naumovozyma dairenensis CBS 421]
MTMDEKSKLEYLKDVNSAADRIRHHLAMSHQQEVEEANRAQAATTVVPEFKRVPLPTMNTAPPMLEKNCTSSFYESGSTLEMWEESVEQKLQNIDQDIKSNKFGAADLNTMFASGKIEEMDF